MIIYVIGCKGSAGVRNGAIKGKVALVGGGTLPAVKVRAEGIRNEGGSTISRYTITDRSDGSFYIPNVPVGIYEIYFQVEGYEIASITGQDTSGEGETSGSLNGYINSGIKAYIENGNVYEIPTVYFKKIVSRAPGTISGHIYSQVTGQAISGAVVAIGNSTLATISDINGRYVLSNVPAGAVTLVVSKEGYETVNVDVNVVADTEITRDIRLPSAHATINGNLVPDNYPDLFNDEWDNIIVTVDGVEAEVNVNPGKYTVHVPIGPSSYTIRINHPYIDETIVRVDGPLTEGQVIQAPDAHIRWKTGTVTVQVWTNTDQDGNDDRCVVLTEYGIGDGLCVFVDTDDAFGNPGTDFMASTTFTEVPIGKRKFETVGAASLDGDNTDRDVEINVHEGSQTVSIFVGQ